MIRDFLLGQRSLVRQSTATTMLKFRVSLRFFSTSSIRYGWTICSLPCGGDVSDLLCEFSTIPTKEPVIVRRAHLKFHNRNARGWSSVESSPRGSLIWSRVLRRSYVTRGIIMNTWKHDESSPWSNADRHCTLLTVEDTYKHYRPVLIMMLLMISS